MKNVRGIICLSIGLLFLFPSNAYAHAQVTGTFPKSNSTLTMVPDQVWIEFDGNLTEIEGADVNFLEVRDSSGASITNGKTIVAGARVIINLSTRVNPGMVKVSYRVVSGDGHPVEGGFNFNLSTPDLSSSDASPTARASKKTTSADEQTTSSSAHSSEMSINEQESVASDHEHESFFHRHSFHIYEALIATGAIVAWFLYERRNRRSNR
jgi:methionine-rich copper-binding protein CopC